MTWDGKGYDNFEQLDVSGGALRLDGSASYQRVMIVDSADADRTKVRLGAGLVAEVARNVRLNVGYRAEFGDQARHNVTSGLSVSF